jgi:hypothetical protein
MAPSKGITEFSAMRSLKAQDIIELLERDRVPPMKMHSSDKVFVTRIIYLRHI